MKMQPGELFPVQYGNEKTIEVQALGIPGKRRLINMMLQIGSFRDRPKTDGQSMVLELYDLYEDALRLCVPGLTDEQFEGIDEADVSTIVSKAIEGQSLSEVERKKSESPPLSDAENCASSAAGDVGPS